MTNIRYAHVLIILLLKGYKVVPNVHSLHIIYANIVLQTSSVQISNKGLQDSMSSAALLQYGIEMSWASPKWAAFFAIYHLGKH